MQKGIGSAALIFAFLATVQVAIAQAPATAQSSNTVDLYLRARALIKVDSPAQSELEYRSYPPYPEEWHKLAKAAWETNAPARELVHQAWLLNRASWPKDETVPLNACRGVACEVLDAAVYQHLQGDHAAAMQSVADIMHMSDMLKQPPEDALRTLVAGGVDALVVSRIMVIVSGATLTADPGNKRDFQVSDARGVIARLLVQTDPADWTINFEGASRARAIESLYRNNVERSLGAMSLACHIFKFEKGRWPNNLAELVPNYLPSVSRDPWGNPGDTLGYVLIKGGLPDGSDRPLVYSRCLSRDGMFFRIDEPQYDFYVDDGSDLPRNMQKQGGQFRDIARWVPNPNAPKGPTTRPLP